MSFTQQSQALFQWLKNRLFDELGSSEELSLSLNGEETLYVRFRNSKVRQNTHLELRQLEMTFQKNHRRVAMQTDLTGHPESDLKTCLSLLQRARREVEILPEDPGSTPFENRGRSQTLEDSKALRFEDLMMSLESSTQGTDFTGLLATGPQVRANANSHGQEHWFSTRSFFLDYSLYTVNGENENKAVKGTYADKEWNDENFLADLSFAKNQLALLKRKNHDVKPGAYRVFLAPAAVSDLIAMLSWNALSYGAYKKGACAFAKLADKQEKLSPLFSLRENFDLGLATPFNSLGELPPRQLSLIEKGELKNFLVSTRSGQEFGAPSNGAEFNSWGQEFLRSPEVLGGTLPEKNALKELGTGLYLNNLHYCNWSDLQTARVTGMTRYACFWVENGEIVAPIRDLRFDDSLYSVFGKNLQAVTQERHIQPDMETYYERPLGGKFLPGLLLNQFQFTL